MLSRLVGSAHLVQGGSNTVAQVLQLLESEGITTKGNPDMYVREYARFGADDAREVRERAQTRAVGKDGRIFVVTMPTMTTEAQNVLLKTLEEPSAGAVFFLIVPAPQALLPTLRSRMQVLKLDASVDDELVDAKQFLAASGEKRLDMLKPLLEKDDDDKRDLRPVLSFLSALEVKLARNPEGLRALYGARKYIGDKGALVKPLLEQVALLVPRV